MGRMVARPKLPSVADELRWQVGGSIDDVAEHGAGRGHPARSPAVEHEIADGAALDEHGVEAPVDRGERVVLGDHRRVDPDRHLGALVRLDGLGDRDGFDDEAEVTGVRDIGGRDRPDALVVDVAGHHRGAEREGGHDGHLGARVVPLDVGGGIALGVAQALGLGQRLLIRRRRRRSSG